MSKKYYYSKKLRINNIERVFYKLAWKIYCNRDVLAPLPLFVLIIAMYLLCAYVEGVTP